MSITNFSQGSIGWKFQTFRRDILTGFLDDLVEHKGTGFSNNECDEVKKVLEKLTNYYTAVPLKNIWKHYNKFSKIYSEWNKHIGNHDTAKKNRDSNLLKLRKIRYKIGKKSRKIGRIVDTEADLKFIDAQYEAMNNLVKAFPEIFKNLSKALVKILTKLDKLNSAY